MKSTVVYLKPYLWSPSATFGWSSPSTNKLTVTPRREWGFICFMSFAGRQFSRILYRFSGENQTLNFSAVVTELYLLFCCYFWSASRSAGWKRLTWILWQHFHAAWGKGAWNLLWELHSVMSEKEERTKKTLLLFQKQDIPCEFFCILVLPYSHKPFSLLGGMC